jgi:hypothetical protein
LQLLVSVLTRNALYGSWFNRPPGICPCPLYTPPVALTDGLLCEFEGLAFLLWKLKRTVWSKGKRSRNKASVGEPADGSLRCFYPILNAHIFCFSPRSYAHVCGIASTVRTVMVSERKKERKRREETRREELSWLFFSSSFIFFFFLSNSKLHNRTAEKMFCVHAFK